MKSKAQSAYEDVQKRLLMAPGMIEESERRLLFKYAFNCRSLPVVEFGVFFGASTLALTCGISSMKANPAHLTCIDSFEVEADHSFHKYVIIYAKRCGAENLLQINGTKTNWMKITQAVLGSEAKNVRLIKGIVDKNFDMSLLPETIGLLHLDLPKDAETMRPILKGAFPRLIKGSIIAFQDYAYQFSNELIAFFELLEQCNYIKAVNIAASSMFFEVQKKLISASNLNSLLHEAVKNQTSLIQQAIQKYKDYSNSRPQQIIALHAAAIQAVRTSQPHSSFTQQSKIAYHLQEMNHLEANHAARVLSELLTR